MYNLSKAFDIDSNGLSIEGGAGFLSGSASPTSITGSRAIVYVRNNGEIWFKPASGSWGLVHSLSSSEMHQTTSYTGDVVTAVEFFKAAEKTQSDRVARYDFTYTGDDLTEESIKYYDSNGTSVLITFTWTHTYTNNKLQSSSVVVS
jgi:hypothetical protein